MCTIHVETICTHMHIFTHMCVHVHTLACLFKKTNLSSISLMAEPTEAFKLSFSLHGPDQILILGFVSN